MCCLVFGVKIKDILVCMFYLFMLMMVFVIMSFVVMVLRNIGILMVLSVKIVVFRLVRNIESLKMKSGLSWIVLGRRGKLWFSKLLSFGWELKFV